LWHTAQPRDHGKNGRELLKLGTIRAAVRQLANDWHDFQNT
jgi:hypothetical protein